MDENERAKSAQRRFADAFTAESPVAGSSATDREPIGEPNDGEPGWGVTHSAWQHARDVRSCGAFDKEPLPVEVLTAICEVRLGGLAAVREALRNRPNPRLRFSRPRRHDRDGNGRNWTVDSLEADDAQTATFGPALQAELERLRDTFDLL